MGNSIKYNGLQCPLPLDDYPNIVLAHGSGGKLTHQLIEKLFRPVFENDLIETAHDSVVLESAHSRIAMTTDSYVVNPIFFPGGDIGSLAVHGTVNDLVMSGAEPQFISVAFILEEGLPVEDLWKIVVSMKQAADKAGVKIVTGDTKVVDRGKGDKIFINTTGIGLVKVPQTIHPLQIRPGDRIIVSGDIGRHGICILLEREGLQFEHTIESDSAPLNAIVAELLKQEIPVHCMRDCTRGGLATSLIEIAESSDLHFEIQQDTIPVLPEVESACEILGLDPLYVANEGRFVLFVPENAVEKTLRILRSFEPSESAAEIGVVQEGPKGKVFLKTTFGTRRILDMFTGEQLPRIC